MHMSSLVVDKARQLAAAGHHAEVVEYLGAQQRSELAGSPTLALLYGTAQARLGCHDEGLRWLDLALDEARRREEPAVEGQALNARGAIAVVSGRIDEAADYFTKALMAASRDGDIAMTGRCSNNLGVISSLRGRHAEASGPPARRKRSGIACCWRSRSGGGRRSVCAVASWSRRVAS